MGNHCWSSIGYLGQEVSSFGLQRRSIEIMTEIARFGLVRNNQFLDKLFNIRLDLHGLNCCNFYFAAMVSLTKSICWKVVAKTVDSSGIGLVIYQKPTSESCYKKRSMQDPPLCGKEKVNASWYKTLAQNDSSHSHICSLFISFHL